MGLDFDRARRSRSFARPTTAFETLALIIHPEWLLNNQGFWGNPFMLMLNPHVALHCVEIHRFIH